MINNSRSMNWDFAQGALDNTYKCYAPDQGGAVNEVEANKRGSLLGDSGIYDEPMDAYDQAFLSPRMRQSNVSSTHEREDGPSTYDFD